MATRKQAKRDDIEKSVQDILKYRHIGETDKACNIEKVIRYIVARRERKALEWMWHNRHANRDWKFHFDLWEAYRRGMRK